MLIELCLGEFLGCLGVGFEFWLVEEVYEFVEGEFELCGDGEEVV